MSTIIELSAIELRVLDALLDSGGTNKQVADQLGLTENVVKQHLKFVMSKTGCASRTELVVAVLRDRIRVGSMTTRAS